MLKPWFYYETEGVSPRLDHNFIQLGPAPSTLPSLPNLLTRTCAGTLSRWEPMWQYRSTQAIKLLWHVKELHQLTWDNESDVNLKICNLTRYCHICSQRGGVPTHVRAQRSCIEIGVVGAEPNWMKMWYSLGHPISVAFLQKKNMGQRSNECKKFGTQ